MRGPRRAVAAVLAATIGVGTAGVAVAQGGETPGAQAVARPPVPSSFHRVATYGVYRNNADPDATTVAEIAAATADGRTLVSTDSEQGAIGLLDLTDPSAPVGKGTIAVGGQPTSVAIKGGLALVAVDTTEDLTQPSGHLAVIDLATGTEVATLALAGQPDSIKVSPDGRWAAVVIENQRDEEVEVGGVEGGLPQLPPGLLQVLRLQGPPAAWTVRDVALTGLADVAPEDPEPEFVDINDTNVAVVTLQENNHIVLVDLPTARVVRDFPAGSVDLQGIDTVEDGVIDPTGSLDDVPREPDGVTWLNRTTLATANEGDLAGGSRSFSTFGANGMLLADSGNAVDQLGIRIGQYPEDRSENKGTEPEGVEHGRFGGRDLLFVGSERANFVAVYDVGNPRRPTFTQVLPTARGPEGIVAIPQRGLLVATSEEDLPPTGVRTAISIYQWGPGGPTYPQLISSPTAADLVPWGAISGLAALPGTSRRALAVSDSAYSEGFVYTVDTTTTPALVLDRTAVTGGSGDFDFEGVTVAPDGTRWIASEGNASDSRPNRLVQVDASGAVLAEVGLPPEVLACRAASTNRGSLGAGFEGVTAVLTGGGYVLEVAQQRGWDYTTPECEALDDDPDGTNPAEPGWTRVWVYDPTAGSWSSIPYQLEPIPTRAAWVGLSEITHLPDGRTMLIERDNLSGDFAELKWLSFVDLSQAGGVTRETKGHVDLLPALAADHGWFTDKPEGATVLGNGQVVVVTDNDGLDESTGETQVLRLGPLGGLDPGA